MVEEKPARKKAGAPRRTVSYRIGKLMPVALKYIENVVNGKEKHPNGIRVSLCLKLVGHLMKQESQNKKADKLEEAALEKSEPKEEEARDGGSYDSFIKGLHEEGEDAIT